MIDGKKNPDRREQVERGESPIPPLRFREYVKTATCFAARMTEPFEVDTLEGRHSGKAGDWLAIGVAGEMYPIDSGVFSATYREVADDYA